MRLEGQAKAGFYPTPPKTLRLIEEILERLPRGEEPLAALDPCAGEGEALFRAARAAGMRPYGIELDEERAQKAAQTVAPLEGRLFQGDAFEYTAGGFSLLWLNPPYDWDGEGNRLEERFLRHFFPALEEGGLLILVFPERVLEEVWPSLAWELKAALIFRLPDPEYDLFKQAVLIGVKKGANEYGLIASGRLPLVHPGSALEKAAPVLEAFRPRPVRPFVRRAYASSADEALALARQSPLWSEVETSKSEFGFRPLAPLKSAHLALLLAAGYMDLMEVELEGSPHLVIGVLRKENETFENENGDRVTRERFSVGLTALNLRTGEIKEVRE